MVTDVMLGAACDPVDPEGAVGVLRVPPHCAITIIAAAVAAPTAIRRAADTDWCIRVPSCRWVPQERYQMRKTNLSLITSVFTWDAR
jgi:hypothetical protein